LKDAYGVKKRSAVGFVDLVQSLVKHKPRVQHPGEVSEREVYERSGQLKV
jgi:hypothetical protein